MANGRSVAALAVFLAAVQLLAVLPLSGGLEIVSFSDGSAEALALLGTGGNATVANLSVPLSSVVLDGSLTVSTLAGAGWPLSPALDIGADGTDEWRFEGTGYGRFGSQELFSDGGGVRELSFDVAGNGTARVLLPGNATVSSASLDIEGLSGQSWWNASWRGRLPLTVKDLSGRNQTNFTVEVLLDTRNWTLGSAEREFRVTEVNSTTLEETEVPLQVIDEINNGSKCFEAGLVFAVLGLGAGASRTFHLYFDNPGAQRSAAFTDFRPRLLKSLLPDRPGDESFFGPVAEPAGASFDRDGNYWVADQGRAAVFGFTGTLGTPDVPGSDASRLRFPSDVAVSPDGKVVVADRDNYRVQVFEPDGTVSFTLGTTGSAGTDNSHFAWPAGVGTDAEGSIYVSDSTNHRVQIFDRNGTYITTLGEPGVSGSDNDHFYLPAGIHVSPSKDVLVADMGNHRVQAWAHSGGQSWSWNYTLGTSGVPGSDNLHFTVPFDVCADGSGRTYVADTMNHRVQVFSGKVLKATLGESGVPGADNGHLGAPMGVAVSPAGRIFVSDTGNGRVQVFDSSHKYVQSLGNRSAACYPGAGATDGNFDTPGGVSTDPSGRIYVSDTFNQRVQVFTALGGLVTTLGQTGAPGSDSTHFLFPRGLDVAPDGKVYVADGGGHPPTSISSNNRVMVFFDLADVTADLQLGITGQSGNTSVNLNQPWDVSVNAAGRVAVADKGIVLPGPTTMYRGTRVQVFEGLDDSAADLTFGVSGSPGMDSVRLNFPKGVGVTEEGWVYVADTLNNRVVLFKNDGDATADFVLNPSGTAGAGQGQFRMPCDVDVDGSGYIYVADTGNNRISVFDGMGVHKYFLGDPSDNRSDDRHLDQPQGIKVADDGKLLVADTGNNRVVRISPASLETGGVEALAAPVDLALDVGADGTPEWVFPGALSGLATVSGLESATQQALRDGSGTTDGFGNELVEVALNFSNAGTGRVLLSNLSVTYDCAFMASNLGRAAGDYVLLHAAEADASGNVSVPVLYSASSAGGVRLGNLWLLVDIPPVLLEPLPDRELDEDSSAPSLYDLSEYFEDDFDTVLDYSLVNLTNSSAANLTVADGHLLSVDCTVPSARNWNGVIGFSVRAADSRGLATESGPVRVTVRPVNDPPDITSSPPMTAARVGTEWSYSASASDPDGDALTFTLEIRPGGMIVNASSGRLSWTPSAGDLGTHQVGLRVTDGYLSDRQNFSVNVAPADAVNRPPVILSTPVTAAETGKPYSYQVVVRDDDNDRLTYSLDVAPSGMTVNNGTGLVAWTPLASQEGRHAVVVRVDDGKVSVTQDFNVTVSASIADILPAINVTSPVGGARVHGTVLIRGTASSRNSTLEAVEVSVDLDGRWVAADGLSSWTYRLDTTKLSNGKHTVFVRAKDAAGNFGQANITIDVQNVAATPAADILLGLPLLAWLLIVVVIVAAASAGAWAVHRKKRGPAQRPAAPLPISASMPPAVAAPPGVYTMTAPEAAYTPAAASAATPQAAPAARHPAPGTRHPVKAVDSVFLIYHDGRLITYFSRSESIKLDDTLDMIRKFVRASFSGQLGKLDSMRYENMNIIMERGNLMYMVVITPLAEYDAVRREMRLLLEEINNQYRVMFKIWDGDFNKVKGVKTMVERFAGEEISTAPPAAAPLQQSTVPRGPPAVPPGPQPPSQPAPEPSQQPPPRPSQEPAPPTPSPQEPPPLTAVPPPTPVEASPALQENPPMRKVRGLLEMEDEEEEPAGEIPGPEEQAPKIPPVAVPRRRPAPSKAEEAPSGEDVELPSEPEKVPPAGEPQTGEPPTGEPQTGEPPAGEPQTGEPPAKEPPAGEPQTAEPPAPKPPSAADTMAPTPPPEPPAMPQATGLTDAERMRLLEDRFLRGEITELTYRELRDKLSKK